MNNTKRIFIKTTRFISWLIKGIFIGVPMVSFWMTVLLMADGIHLTEIATSAANILGLSATITLLCLGLRMMVMDVFNSPHRTMR